MDTDIGLCKRKKGQSATRFNIPHDRLEPVQEPNISEFKAGRCGE